MVIVKPAGTRSAPEHAGHLGDVGALAAEQVAHVPRALGEVVDPLLVRHGERAYCLRHATASRTCAWCSSVSGSRARPARARAAGRRAPRRAGGRGRDQEVVRLLVERERARLAGGADHAAGGAGEADEVLALAAGRAGGELGREAGGEQQLEAEGERVGAAGAAPGRASSSASSLASRW